MKEKTCCFTGHRNIPKHHLFFIRKYLKLEITKLIEGGYCFFGSGGALGFDTEVSLAILELKKEYPHIKLILVLPCATQTKHWQREDILAYESILNQADKVCYTSQKYYNGCMHKRNRHLVEFSSVCIAYLYEKNGGTAYTVDYALNQNIRVINIANMIERNEEF